MATGVTYNGIEQNGTDYEALFKQNIVEVYSMYDSCQILNVTIERGKDQTTYENSLSWSVFGVLSSESNFRATSHKV